MLLHRENSIAWTRSKDACHLRHIHKDACHLRHIYKDACHLRHIHKDAGRCIIKVCKYNRTDS